MIKVTALSIKSRTIHNLRNFIIKPDRSENFKIIHSFEDFGYQRMAIIENTHSDTNNYRKLWSTYFDMYE